MSTIADRLKKARELAGLSQAELARRAGVAAGTIGNLEAGTRRAPREILALAAALNVRPEWLRDGVGPMSAPPAAPHIASEPPAVWTAPPWPLGPYITPEQWMQLRPDQQHVIAWEASKAYAALQAMAADAPSRKPPTAAAA